MAPSLRSEIVVGIDFGTTHSGVSWVLNEGQKKVRLINDWPDPFAKNANADKVPSTISYKSGRVEKWGYYVRPKDESFRWFKILLEPECQYSETTQHIRKSSELLSKTNKTAEEVVRDYLKEIWEYTKEDIRKHVGLDDWEKNFTVHVVLTVPAMWTPLAKVKTLRAAAAAGLPVNIRLVTEPEAAALVTLRDKADNNTLQEGDAFVVCDAGGGTVDLISYKINSLEPLDIEECAVSGGGLCGSVFLDIAFEKSIRMMVGEDEYTRLKDRDKKDMLSNFEYGVKRAFTAQSDQDYSVDLRGVEDNEALGILDETITLKKTMLASQFDFVCLQVGTLVQNQIREVKQNGLVVKAIMLVGGFGSSKFLHDHLEKSYSSEKIAILQVDGAWSAICKGACLWGLEHINQPLRKSTSSSTSSPRVQPPTITGRIAKYSYGVVVSRDFDGSKHLLSDRFLNPATNTYKANNQMRWLLYRGQKITVGQQLSVDMVHYVHGVSVTAFAKQEHRDYEQALHYCQDNDPPSRKDDSVKELCRVKYSVPETSIWMEDTFRSEARPGKWRKLVFNLAVELRETTLEYVVKYKDKCLSSIEAKYVEPTS